MRENIDISQSNNSNTNIWVGTEVQQGVKSKVDKIWRKPELDEVKFSACTINYNG